MGGEFLLGKVLIQRCRQVLFLKQKGSGGTEGGDVRHLGRAGAAGGNHGELFLRGGRAGDEGDIENNAPLLADGGVKLPYLLVHGRLHLPAEVVSEGENHRVVRMQPLSRSRRVSSR